MKRTKINVEVMKHQGDYYSKEDEFETSNVGDIIRYLMRKCDDALQQGDEELLQLWEELQSDWEQGHERSE